MQGQAKEKQGELHLPAFLSSTHFKSEECFYVIIVHEPVCVVEIKFNFTLHVQFQDSVPSIIINERITGLFIDATPKMPWLPFPHCRKAVLPLTDFHLQMPLQADPQCRLHP